jgi:hypothetical protein
MLPVMLLARFGPPIAKRARQGNQALTRRKHDFDDFLAFAQVP